MAPQVKDLRKHTVVREGERPSKIINASTASNTSKQSTQPQNVAERGATYRFVCHILREKGRTSKRSRLGHSPFVEGRCCSQRRDALPRHCGATSCARKRLGRLRG